MSCISSAASTGDEAGSEKGPTNGAVFSHDNALVHFCEYNGMLMGYYDNNTPDVHVPKVMAMNIRDTDILLLTYPKSGTHWLWRVLNMLVSGSAEYVDIRLENFVIDIVPIEVMDQISTDVRRVFHSHYPTDMLPAQFKDGRAKVVHLYRHPKAVLASMFNHMLGVKELSDTTLDKLEDTVYAEKTFYKNQFYYLDKIKEYEQDNPNLEMFHLAYEDMKKDTLGSIKKLAAYLNVDASDELCTSIAQAVSFSSQKEKEECVNELQKNLQIYRKGEVDDWKNHLTVAQSERMDRMLAKRAVTCRFCRRYCPTITTEQGHVYRLSSTS